MNDYVTIWVTAGEPETGLWCDACMLPARIRIRVYQMSASGFTPLCVYDACTECDEFDLGGADGAARRGHHAETAEAG